MDHTLELVPMTFFLSSRYFLLRVDHDIFASLNGTLTLIQHSRSVSFGALRYQKQLSFFSQAVGATVSVQTEPDALQQSARQNSTYVHSSPNHNSSVSIAVLANTENTEEPLTQCKHQHTTSSPAQAADAGSVPLIALFAASQLSSPYPGAFSSLGCDSVRCNCPR